MRAVASALDLVISAHLPSRRFDDERYRRLLARRRPSALPVSPIAWSEMVNDHPEPPRLSPGGALSAKMSTLARRDTKPEVDLRRALHSRGLRFRVQLKVPVNRRRTIDIAFTRVRLAVYVDGCFWHGCPEHHVLPRTNATWWEWKLDLNRRRDRSTNEELRAAGWHVLRLWEHTPTDAAADAVARIYCDLRRTR